MIKGIIFDCFGVLVADDFKARIAAVDRMDPEAGRRLHELLDIIDKGQISLEESSKQMGEIMGIDPDELVKAIDDGLVKNTQLTAFIRTLKPQFNVAILSNVRGRDRLEQLFDDGELDELFDVVVASGDEGFIKPGPEIYELTAKRLGIDPKDCVMIDDLSHYCDGAKAVGMRAIQFEHTDQAIDDLKALIDRENQTN